MYSVEFDDFAKIEGGWDIAFVGSHNDERDIKTREFLASRVGIVLIVDYDQEEMSLLVNSDKEIQIHELSSWLGFCKNKKVVLDATSMSVAELYLLSKHLHNASVLDFEIIYVEPQKYTKTENNFTLSDSGIGFAGAGIPSLTVPHEYEENKHIVFLLGYEGDRFADAMEVMQLEPDQISIFFGVPSYQINWEKNSYKGNLKVILDNSLNDRFVFCGANNPAAVNREVREIQKFHSKSQLYITPIGTKPQAIGCIPILCDSDLEFPIGVLWDHPKRKQGRTSGVSKILITKKLFN